MPGLERSDILEDLLTILDTAPILPAALRGLQPLATRAAIDLLPEPIRLRIGLGERRPLGRSGEAMLRGLARVADRVPLASSPAAQALKRMGLPADYLRRRERSRALRPLEPARG